MSPSMIVLLAPLILLLGIATEASSWFVIQTRLQTAADAAVMAAALNGCDQDATCHTLEGQPTYADEARAVAERYGIEDGARGLSMKMRNDAACPGGGLRLCYEVSISAQLPVVLLRLGGFRGDGLDGPGVTVLARAVAFPTDTTNREDPRPQMAL